MDDVKAFANKNYGDGNGCGCNGQVYNGIDTLGELLGAEVTEKEYNGDDYNQVTDKITAENGIAFEELIGYKIIGTDDDRKADTDE